MSMTVQEDERKINEQSPGFVTSKRRNYYILKYSIAHMPCTLVMYLLTYSVTEVGGI